MHSAAIREGGMRLGPAGESQSLFSQEGRLEVRLTRDAEDIHAAQALRYRVFYEEMGAWASAAMTAERRDFDDFDLLCDHLLVFDHSRLAGEDGGRIIPPPAPGDRRAETAGFYSAGEYDIQPLLAVARPNELLELGRSLRARGLPHQRHHSNCCGAASPAIFRRTRSSTSSVARACRGPMSRPTRCRSPTSTTSTSRRRRCAFAPCPSATST